MTAEFSVAEQASACETEQNARGWRWKLSNKQFFEIIKGPMNNYEDWYSYKIENDRIVITHSWSHVSPSLSADHGSKEYTVEEFQESADVHVEAKIALDATLKLEE